MANTKISVQEPLFGTIVLSSDQSKVNHCRAEVIRHGYQATIRATVNYNAIAACDISVVEQAVLATITEMFARAAAMRAANRALFDVAAPAHGWPHHEEGQKPCS